MIFVGGIVVGLVVAAAGLISGALGSVDSQYSIGMMLVGAGIASGGGAVEISKQESDDSTTPFVAVVVIAIILFGVGFYLIDSSIKAASI
ncbi:MAG: hypothetical protein HOJ22_02110 [Chloroflexi bacterium]|jgi:lipopolysaccharide export LptBFGC system permease protein LptF|nr:hypothetical protein [Chloroflexota bacterium]MBT5627059.1 hypothetical protein [Chloroflexota bacterium]